MRRAPSSRGKDDALRYSVFDAAHQIGLSDPNALRWLEQNSNISEEDEEEELQRETRPPSDAHPPSLVFSASSHDSSIASPSNDHSTNYRAPYRPATKAAYPPYGHSQFQHNQPPNGPLIFTQTQPEIRSPLGSNASSPRISPAQPPLPAGIKQFEQWPPTQLAIASLSPPSQPNSRAPSPGDKGNSKQAPEPKKSRKLTKAQRAEHEPEIITTSRKTSASGESGIGGAPPTLPFLPFPAPAAGETLSSGASVSGLSAISGLSGSSSGTVTQSQFGNGNGSTLFPSGRASNEPRSFFEDDTDDIPPGSSSGHGHTQNSPSTSTANSAEAPHGKEKEGKLLRTMRSFKLSLKGQKAPKLPAPPVPAVPSQPPVLTLKLDKDAMLKQELAQNPPKDASSQAKDREERVLRIAEMFTSEITRTTRSASETGTTLSQPLSELGHKDQADLGHSKADSELGHAVGSNLEHAPIRIAGASRGANNKPAVARRRSVDELDAAIGEPTKVTERTRAGTVGTRSGHARTRSKSGDFTGIGWEKGDRPPVPDIRPVEVVKPEGTVKATGVADANPATAAEVTSATKLVASKPATRFFVTNPTRPAKPANKPAVKPVQPIQSVQPVQPTQPVRPNPLSPNLSFDSETRHSHEREGFGARGERDESRALEVQHQLQSFVASMRGKEDDGTESINDGFGRASGEGIGLGRTSDDAYGRGSEDSRRGVARVRAQGDDSDTLRSSGEYDPDPFRVRAPKSRLGVAMSLPRPESEAIPHQIVIPAHQLPKEVAPIRIAIPTKRTVPPVAYRSPEDELPKGLVRNSSISARPSVVINDEMGESMAAEVAEVQTATNATSERASAASLESEFGLGYSGFDYAREEPVTGEPAPSEEWVVPSPSWAPLEMKQTHSPSVGNANLDPDVIPDSPLEPPIRPGQYLDVRPDRQRASGLSIPRSVTPDSPRPLLIPPRPTMSPFPNAPSPVSTSRSATPLAPSRSTTPLAPARSSTASMLARSATPQPPPSGPPPSVPPPQAQPTSPPQAWRPQLVQRNTPSPPIPRNTLPTRSSSISSMSSVEHSTRSPIARAAPARSVAAPSSRPSTASSVQSNVSRVMSLRSMSTTPTPREREEQPRHEQPSRFLDPETVPTTQKRGRVSPFPVKPLRERSASRDRLKEATEQPSQSQREKYPGGIDRFNGTDGFMQVPRVRFIGVRSSNGSSQAGWQGRMEDMNKAESPVQSDAGAWYEEEARPVSWQEYEEPTYLSYDDPEGYGRDSRHSAYEDAAREDDFPAPEAGPDVVAALSALRPSGQEQPAWAVDDTTPASRASTFTLASVYDDDDDDIPPVPKTERLAAAVRGMGQNNWAAGRI